MPDYVIGIDEAGRGPLAGPIQVAVLAIPKNFRYSKLTNEMSLRDSKKLSPRQREKWFQIIKNHPHIHFTTSRTYPRKIDRINIRNAGNLAAAKALEKIYKFISYKFISSIYIDAGIEIIPAKNLPTYKLTNLKTLVRGDELIPAISLASIVAKVTRDTYMIRKHKKLPQYNFHKHKGYGTAEHRKLIKKHGSCPLHRLTFIGKIL